VKSLNKTKDVLKLRKQKKDVAPQTKERMTKKKREILMTSQLGQWLLFVSRFLNRRYLKNTKMIFFWKYKNLLHPRIDQMRNVRREKNSHVSVDREWRRFMSMTLSDIFHQFPFWSLSKNWCEKIHSKNEMKQK
jgi:hypothetical protein